MKILARAAAASVAIALGSLTPAHAQSLSSASSNFDLFSPLASSQSAAPIDENAVSFEAKAQENGNIVVELSENGRFVSDGKNVNVVDADGEIVDVLTPQLKDEVGRTATLSFHQVTDHELVITPTDVYSPYGYWSCVGKNAAGGVVGGAAAGCASGVWFAGAGCLAGAGAGAVTTGIGTGVGSLIWCA